MLAWREGGRFETAEERERFVLLGIFFGNAFIIIVVVKVVLVDVRQVAARRPADVRRQALLQILLDVGLYTQLG